MSAVAVAAGAMLRGWRHEMIRTLGSSVAAYRAVLAVLVLAAAGWVYLATATSEQAGVGDLAGVGIDELLVTTGLNLAVALSVTATAGLMVLAPEETAFGTLLATLPLRPVQRRLALDSVVVAFGLASGLLISGPILWGPAVRLGVAVVLGLTVTWIALAVAGVLVGSTLLRLGVLVLCRVSRVSTNLARAVAALGATGLVVAQCLAGQTPTSHSQLREWLDGLTRLVLDRPLLAAGVGVALAVAAAALWWAAVAMADRTQVLGSSRFAGPLGSRLRARPRSALSAEVIQLVRHPANSSVLVVVLGAAVATVVSAPLRAILVWPLGAALLLGLTSMMFIGSYGATATHHWMYRVLSDRPVGWIGAKWAAALLTWLVMIAVLDVVFLLTPEWTSELILGVLPQLFSAFLASMVIGLLIPVSDEQPLSSLAASAVAGVAGIGLATLLGQVAGDSTIVLLGLTCVVAAALLAGYRWLAHWREHDLVF